MRVRSTKGVELALRRGKPVAGRPTGIQLVGHGVPADHGFDGLVEIHKLGWCVHAVGVRISLEPELGRYDLGLPNLTAHHLVGLQPSDQPVVGYPDQTVQIGKRSFME